MRQNILYQNIKSFRFLCKRTIDLLWILQDWDPTGYWNLFNLFAGSWLLERFMKRIVSTESDLKFGGRIICRLRLQKLWDHRLICISRVVVTFTSKPVRQVRAKGATHTLKKCFHLLKGFFLKWLRGRILSASLFK